MFVVYHYIRYITIIGINITTFIKYQHVYN